MNTPSPRAALAALLLSLLPWGAQAQVAPEPRNVVSLQASASREVMQDWMAVTLSTTRDGLDAQAVQGQLKAALEAALVVARPAAEGSALVVRTGHLSLYPRSGRDGKLNGWQGSAEMVIEGRDLARISTTAGKVSTLTVANVAFTLSRDERLKVEADIQQAAIEAFRAKALGVAKSFGFAGYALREVSLQGGDPMGGGRPVMMAMARAAPMADAPLPIEAGRTTVQVTVSGSIRLE